MKSLFEIQDEIIKLREDLILLTEENNYNFLHPSIVELSTELDELLLLYYKHFSVTHKEERY